MTDTEFLHRLDEAFEKIQEADIKGEDLIKSVTELEALCSEYIKFRITLADKERDPLNGSD